MQLMPRTTAYVGVRDSFDPGQNVRGGAMAVKKKGVNATAEAAHYVASIKSYYTAAQPKPWLGASAAAVAAR